MDTNIKGSVYTPLLEDLYYAENLAIDEKAVADIQTVDDKLKDDKTTLNHM